MIAAVIDIGSNTMRMSVYKIEGQKFTVLLSKKETAGLVNYITEGEMSEEGIGVLIDVLQQFCSSLEEISVNSINAFATASLRNVANSEQVLARIFHAVGLKVELRFMLLRLRMAVFSTWAAAVRKLSPFGKGSPIMPRA